MPYTERDAFHRHLREFKECLLAELNNKQFIWEQNLIF